MSIMEAKLSQLKNALQRFSESLQLEKNDIVRDSCIQRFEFCVDLTWKTLKYFLQEKHGILCNSPKECIKEAYKLGLIEYNEKWLSIIDARNLTTHTYNEQIAEQIYNFLPQTLPLPKSLVEKISENI